MPSDQRPCPSCGEPTPTPDGTRVRCRACRKRATNRAAVERARAAQPPAPEKARGSVLTSEVDCTPEEWEFAAAMDRYRRERGRPFPTWSEAFAVLKSLGYRKVAPPDAAPGAG